MTDTRTQTSAYARNVQRVFDNAPSDLNTFDELFDVEGPGTVLHEWTEAQVRVAATELGRKYRLRVRRGWFRESVAFDHASPIGPLREVPQSTIQGRAYRSTVRVLSCEIELRVFDHVDPIGPNTEALTDIWEDAAKLGFVETGKNDPRLSAVAARQWQARQYRRYVHFTTGGGTVESPAAFDYPYPIGPRAYFATAHAEFYTRH